jgi:DNA-binding transcriptional ArsR family regulator
MGPDARYDAPDHQAVTCHKSDRHVWADICLDSYISVEQCIDVPTASRASLFEVLAEPNRRRLLDLLRGDERPVGELVTALQISQPAVSKHLRVLRDAGVVASRRDGQRRLYRVHAAPLQELDAWLAPYRAMWEARLDDLARHLDAMPDDPDDERGAGK